MTRWNHDADGSVDRPIFTIPKLPIEPSLRFISLGAGVQSTTMALMAASGEIAPMPDCAIFADTGWEPKAVYEHLDRLEKALPFPVYRVSTGALRADVIARRNSTGGRFSAVPWFTVNPDGSKGMGRRQCTREYKLKPIMHKLRELLGKSRRGRIKPGTVECWIGISRDEATRMKPSRVQWTVHRWPLIEALMSRSACERWLRDHGHPIPQKSACIGCPFHNDAMWADMKANRPEEWADAVAVDAALRSGKEYRGRVGVEYMHSSCVPLPLVMLKTGDRAQMNLFENECEGMCGV